MQGVMVTFHNTRKVFGFEHIPLYDMEEILFGGKEAADAAFNTSTLVLEKLLRRVTDRFKDDDILKITAQARKVANTMRVFVERVPAEESPEEAAERERLLSHLERGHPGKLFQLKAFDPQNHVLRLDRLGEEDIRSRLRALGLPDGDAREHALSRLEDAEMERFDGAMPSGHFYSDLARGGRLIMYEIQMRHVSGRSAADRDDADREVLYSPPKRDFRNVTTQYSVRDVTGLQEPVTLATLYRKLVGDMNTDGGGVVMCSPADGEEPEFTGPYHLTAASRPTIDIGKPRDRARQ